MPNATTTQIIIGTTPTLLDALQVTERKVVRIRPLKANTLPIYVGFDSSVSTSTGYELSPGETLVCNVDQTLNFYAIASSSGQVACVYQDDIGAG